MDIAQQIQLESREIQAQERELNIRKIRLAIKTLYTFFEGEEDVRLSNKTLSETVKLLSVATQQCKKDSLGQKSDENRWLHDEIITKHPLSGFQEEAVAQFFDDDDEND